MTRSESINELASALAAAQAAIEGASKSSENPHYRSRYADLAATWDACRKPLADNGLAVVQFPRLVHLGDGDVPWAVELETTLMHKSGQWMADMLAIPLTRADAQGVGSAITYARRYALAAVVGVAPEDDDGEAAVAPNPLKSQFRQQLEKSAALGRRPADEGHERVRGKVLGIMDRPAGTGTRYIITLDNQRTYGTLVKPFADVARGAQEAAADVELVFRTTRLGNEVVSVRDLSEDEPPI